jgi:hypothetical protein
MRDGKNITNSPLSHENVLISGYGNGTLRAVFTAREDCVRFRLEVSCRASAVIIVDTCAQFAYKKER